jgi:hypothetical protein
MEPIDFATHRKLVQAHANAYYTIRPSSDLAGLEELDGIAQSQQVVYEFQSAVTPSHQISDERYESGWAHMRLSIQTNARFFCLVVVEERDRSGEQYTARPSLSSTRQRRPCSATLPCLAFLCIIFIDPRSLSCCSSLSHAANANHLQAVL